MFARSRSILLILEFGYFRHVTDCQSLKWLIFFLFNLFPPWFVSFYFSHYYLLSLSWFYVIAPLLPVNWNNWWSCSTNYKISQYVGHTMEKSLWKSSFVKLIRRRLSVTNNNNTIWMDGNGYKLMSMNYISCVFKAWLFRILCPNPPVLLAWLELASYYGEFSCCEIYPLNILVHFWQRVLR